MWEYTDKVRDHFINPRNVGEIESSTMWKKKKNILKEKIAIGPQVTFGYNFSEKKPEIILGLGITYDLW